MTSLEVRSPFDNELIDTVALDGEVELERKLARAHALHSRGDFLPKHERLAVLERAARAIEARQEELARLAAHEGGKPLADSRVEIGRAVEGLRTAQAVLHHAGGREIPMELSAATAGRFAHTLLEPLGLVGAISAFNHPFNLAVHQVIPAVATGCPVLIKPARKTPLSCRALLQILHEAGLAEGRAEMTVTGPELAKKLASDSRLRFFSFIGSAEVGFELARSVAPGVPVALEHGGVAPLLLHETADFEAAVRGIVKGGYYHAGQVCVSVQRVFVPRSRLDEFLAAFVPAVEALRTGDPLDAATEVGPLISAAELARVEEWINEAVAAGGRLLTGGKRLSASLFEPTIVVDPPEHVRLSTREVFGPVVAVYGYDDWESAIARANAVDSEFQAALFVRDLDVALGSARRLRATAVMVNDHTAFRADWMPFGGRGRSGQGFGGIEDSMRDVWAQRLVVFRLNGR